MGYQVGNDLLTGDPTYGDVSPVRLDIPRTRQRLQDGCGIRGRGDSRSHHLFLTDDDASRLGPLGQMRPPLGKRTDRQALWDNLDVIDMLATDHAPHTLGEKLGENPPPGVPGLETALPLMLTAVGEGRLSMDKLVDMVHGAPSRLFGIGTSDSHIVVETGVRAELRGSEMQTLCRWTPFEGMPVTARILETWLRGARVWGDGRVQVAPGFGQKIATKTRRQGA